MKMLEKNVKLVSFKSALLIFSLFPAFTFAQKGFLNSVEKVNTSNLSHAANSAASRMNQPAIHLNTGSNSNSSSNSSSWNRPAISPGSYSRPSYNNEVRSSSPNYSSGSHTNSSYSAPIQRVPSTSYPSTNSAYYSYPAYYRNSYNSLSTAAQAQFLSPSSEYNQSIYEKNSYSDWIMKAKLFDTFAYMRPVTQEYYIDNAQDSFTIKTETGMQLIFPQNALTDGFGNPVKGKVLFRITEYHTFLDFVTAGLSSSTTDGEMLESGGMIDVKAFAKQSASKTTLLKLAENKTYKIVSTSPFKEGYQTFYGKRGDQVSWSTDNRTAQQNDNNEANKKFTLTIAPIIKYDSAGNNELIVAQDYENKAMSLGDWFSENIDLPKDFKKSLQGEGMHFPATLHVDVFGNIKNVTLNNAEQRENSILKSQWANIKEFLYYAPKLTYTRGGLLDSLISIEFMIVPSNYRSTKNLPAVMPNLVKSPFATSNSAGNWVLESSSLSLVNCDRFSNMVKSKDTIYTQIKHGSALTYFVFFDYNAMLKPNVQKMTETGYKYGLIKFPENAKARIVSIVYEDNGDTHLEVSEYNSTEEQSKPVIMPFNQLTLKASFNKYIPINQLMENK